VVDWFRKVGEARFQMVLGTVYGRAVCCRHPSRDRQRSGTMLPPPCKGHCCSLAWHPTSRHTPAVRC